jgi:polygalacturonase
MNFHPLFIGHLSACFELENKSVYFAEKPYDVRLNGKKVLTGVKTNVFSLFDLEPDTAYEVSALGINGYFHTPAASMIVHLKDFVNPSKNADDTLMFQAALAVLPENGILYVDPGVYHVTSLFLKSHMSLYLPQGATICGNKDTEAYPLLPGELKYLDPGQKEEQVASWEGRPFQGKPSLLNGFFVRDIEIAGQGTIDGLAQDSDFWKDVKNLRWGRPRLVFFDQCQNIVMHGVTLKNAPCWTIHPFFSSHLGFYDLRIENPKDAPNTDGMDPECCKDVNIIGVYFSVGDDCIALKSGKIEIGKKYKTPTEKTVIRNCYMHEGHGAVVLGSEAGAGIKNIKVERCFFDHTDRGLRIKSRRGRGQDSVIDGIVFSDIIMQHVLTPLVINMFYFCDPDGKSEYVWSKEKLPVDERTPRMGSFTFQRITATEAEYALGWFYGLPEMPIKSVTIKDSSFSVKKDAEAGYPAMMSNIDPIKKAGFCFAYVDQVKISHVTASGYEGEEFVLKQVGSFSQR